MNLTLPTVGSFIIIIEGHCKWGSSVTSGSAHVTCQSVKHALESNLDFIVGVVAIVIVILRLMIIGCSVCLQFDYFYVHFLNSRFIID